jgi:hypothetical protein
MDHPADRHVDHVEAVPNTSASTARSWPWAVSTERSRTSVMASVTSSTLSRASAGPGWRE